MIAVLDYGIGNLCSAHKALQHVGADAVLTDDPDVAYSADAVVLPGVGAFGSCMAALRNTGLEEPTLHALRGGKPFLAICVGMQMLYEGSDESPGTSGLGALSGTVRLLPDGVKRPQMQWNRLHARPGPSSSTMFAELVLGSGYVASETAASDGAWMYFLHSYAVDADAANVVATCEYGGPAAAAVVADRVWATQFHPEKSGANGLRLLTNFVASVAELAPVSSH